MRLKPINPEKELKKVQKKGIYNPKLKIVGIAGIIIGIALIYTTYAFFNYNSTKAISFNSQVDKKVNIEIEVKNGTTNNSKITTKYNQELRVKVNPNEGYTYESVICTNSQTGTYDKTNNELIIKPTIYTKCTVTFRETLRHIIIANNILKTQTPDFTKTEPDWQTGKEILGSGLYKTTDETGITYYFRGAVNNNYVKFADKTWRIVRINGDETIRLILEDTVYFGMDLNCNSGGAYTYNNKHICTIENPCTKDDGTSNELKKEIEKWYSENLSKYDNYIALGNFCNDTTNNGRSGMERIKNGSPTLVCPDTTENRGGFYKLKVGMLTADEMNYAGDIFWQNDYYDKFDELMSTYPERKIYLINSEKYKSFLLFNSRYSINDTCGAVYYNVNYGMIDTDSAYYYRPVINLNSNVTISQGDGTKNNPYVIK